MANYLAQEIRIPLPEELVFTGAQAFLLRFCLILLIVSVIRKIFFSKHINPQHAIVSALGIMMMYAACIIIYTFNPMGLRKYLVPLPFITMGEESWEIYSMTNGTDSETFLHILSMLLLAFLVNQIYHFDPKEVKFLGWLIFRICSTGIAIGVHIGVIWVLQKLPLEKLPNIIVKYGPAALIGFFVITCLIGLFKKSLSFFMKKTNPAFDGANTFYFTNKFGLQISRGLVTTVILTVFVQVLDILDFHALPINQDALTQYWPVLGLFFALWCFIGYRL